MKWKKEELKQIIDGWQSGADIQELARKYRRRRSTIEDLLRTWARLWQWQCSHLACTLAKENAELNEAIMHREFNHLVMTDGVKAAKKWYKGYREGRSALTAKGKVVGLYRSVYDDTGLLLDVVPMMPGENPEVVQN
jgi:hypothetical protein